MRMARAILWSMVLATMTILFTESPDAQESVPKDVQKNYPEDRFLVRMGSGESAEEAANKARYEIVQFFESEISGTSIVKQLGESITSRGKTTETMLTELSSTIVVSASRDMPGVEIASNTLNRRTKSYEAWAALDRNKHAALLNERIQSIEEAVNHRLSSETNSDITVLRNLTAIIPDLVLHEQNRLDLMLLDSSAAVKAKRDLLSSVTTSLDSLIAEAFDVGIVFEGEIDNRIQSGITKAVVDAGIRVLKYPDVQSATQAETDLLLVVQNDFSLRTSKLRDREFHSVEWVLSVDSRDPATGAVIDALVQNGKKAGAADDAQSIDRMISDILTINAPTVSSWVNSVIFKPER